jgi:hypothetical protein
MLSYSEVSVSSGLQAGEMKLKLLLFVKLKVNRISTAQERDATMLING